MAPDDVNGSDLGRWRVHGERLVDDTRMANVTIALVELPNGVKFEQYVVRMPRAAMVVVLDEDEAARPTVVFGQAVPAEVGADCSPHRRRACDVWRAVAAQCRRRCPRRRRNRLIPVVFTPRWATAGL